MNPPISDADILGLALGAPARQVLNHAQLHGPRSGWKNGFLSSSDGLCPPDLDQGDICLRRSLGGVWLQLCARLPPLVTRSKVRRSIDALPIISGTSDTVPNQALWAASTALHTLSAAYRCEAQQESAPSTYIIDDSLELPNCLSIPLQQIWKRLGSSPLCTSAYELTICTYSTNRRTRTTSIDIMLSYPIFGSAEESRALLWATKLHTTFAPAIELMAACQERMVANDINGLIRALLGLTAVVKNLAPIIRELDAEDLGIYRRYAALYSPHIRQSVDSPELGLPVFQLMTAMVGRNVLSSSHRDRVVSLRSSLPINIRAFVTAIESQTIGDFVQHSAHTQLRYAWSALVEAHCGAHGLVSVYEQKANAVRSLATRTGQLELLNNATQAGVTAPHDEVATGTRDDSKQAFEHCTVRARVSSRSNIDGDRDRTAALVTLFVQESHGIAFEPGDRLLAMPLNSWTEVEKIGAALGLDGSLNQAVPLYGAAQWDKFARQLHPRMDLQSTHLCVKDVLRYGQIAPLTKAQITALDNTFHGTCPLITKLLESNTWPLMGTLGDVLQMAIEQVSPVIWDTVFDLYHLSWLPDMIPVAEPRAYGISCSALMGESLASSVKVTVSRVSYEVDASLDDGLEPSKRCGMASRALNPHPEEIEDQGDSSCYPFMIGVAPTSSIRLRSDKVDNVVMFAESSSVGVFRSFWRSRPDCIGQTLLFLASPNAAKRPYKDELAQLQHSGRIQVFTSVATETNPLDPDRLLASAILEQGQMVCDLLTSTSDGGLGAHLYLAGSTKLYLSVLSGIRRALYNSDFVLADRPVDGLMAKAASEGRLMLDIYSSPSRPLDANRQISIAQLSRRTGHRPSTQLWLAISENVYDLTHMQSIQPADALTLQLNAGLVATKCLSELVASTPTLSNQLSDFYIGSLAPPRRFESANDRSLFDLWSRYLRFAVETLTGLAHETKGLLRTHSDWYTTWTGRETMHSFLRAQLRLLQNGVSSMFGVLLQELHFRTAFAHISRSRPDGVIADAMGIIARVRGSNSVAVAAKELQTFESISRSSKPSLVQAKGAIQYAQAVTEVELNLLERVGDDVRAAVDNLQNSSAINEQVTSKLLSVLKQVAHRYQTFWEQLSLESVGSSSLHETDLQWGYDIAQKPTPTGSAATATVACGAHLFSTSAPSVYAPSIDPSVNFAHLVDQAMQTVNEENMVAAYTGNRKREQKSSPQFSRAILQGTVYPTVHDEYHRSKAVKALASFLGSSETSIKRLSQLPTDLSFAYIMATYGKNAPSAVAHARSSSAARSVLRTMDSQSGSETPRPRLIRRRPNNSSISSATSQNLFSSPDAGTPETAGSTTSSPMPLQLTLRSRERSASKTSGPHIRLAKDLFSASRKSSVALPTMPLAQTLAPCAADMPPTKGTQSPALLPSPIFPDQKAAALAHARTIRWEMAPVSLSKAEKQASYFGTDTPAPALPLQDIRQHPAPPAELAAPLPSEGTWLGERLMQQIAPRTFSSKQLPIVTLSRKKTTVPLTQVGARVRMNWEMPLLTLSRADLAMPTTGRIHPPAVPTQSVTLVPEFPSVTLPPVTLVEQSARRVVPFTARQLPIMTLSKSERAQPSIHAKCRPLNMCPTPLMSKHSLQISDPSAGANTEPTQAILDPTLKLRNTEGLWPYPQHEAESRERSLFGMSRTVGFVGMWMRPVSKIDNVDFGCCLDQIRHSAHINRSARRKRYASAVLEHDVLNDEAQKKQPRAMQTTQGYVGLWMNPPSRKRNKDFELACLGKPVPLPVHTLAKTLVSEQPKSSKIGPSGRIWQNKSDHHVSSSGRTAGYVGMWMKPVSRIHNSDFEQLRLEVSRLASSPVKRRVTGVRRTDLPIFTCNGLWSLRAGFSAAIPTFTLGSVGMWMLPASKKVNMDFEQLLLNTVNYLLGSDSSWHRRIARDMQLLAAELSIGAFDLVDWAALSKTTHGSHQVALLKEAQSPVRPRRAVEPPSYKGQTLGQIGMWMYPPSRRWNTDFEASKAVAEAAPDLGWKQITLQQSKSAAMPPLRQVREILTVRKKGFVGLWMLPPSQKMNADFEWAKDHSEMALEDQPINPMLPPRLTTATPVLSQAVPIGATESQPVTDTTGASTKPGTRQGERFAFPVEYSTLPVDHAATMTPTSGSTTDGMPRHKIDFEDRLRKLNAELDMEESGLEEKSPATTPVVVEPPVVPWRTTAPETALDTSRRPVLEKLNIDSTRLLNLDGLEVLSAARYTPDSASSGSSAKLLSPLSAARPMRPLRPAQHLWEQDIGPSPSVLPPTPLRTQSTRQPVSRVSSVKNMWEKRASLVTGGPLKAPRNGSRSPPEPLKIQRANTTFVRASGRWMDRKDSATVPGFELMGGHSIDVNSPILSPLSPMSPSVAAY